MNGGKPWRSLDELADTPEFRELLHREFPIGAAWLEENSDAPNAIRRRRFIQLMGASFGLAGITGCGRQKPEKIVPYVNQPENVVPGIPQFYATSLSFCGYARGILVESNLGRPTKIEGNSDHPASLGATDSAGQAAVLDLYDPDRSKTVKYKGRISTWDRFDKKFQTLLGSHVEKNGEGLAVLIEPTTSPSLRRLLTELLEQHPSAQVFQHAPISIPADTPLFDASEPDVILAIDRDFLIDRPDSLRLTRQFVSRRRAGAKPNRLYVVEPTPTLTGAMADHRLSVSPSRLPILRRAVTGHDESLDERETEFVNHFLNDRQTAGNVLVLGTGAKPTEEPGCYPLTAYPDLADLTAALSQRKVRTLLILGGNPVYQCPGVIPFADALKKADFTAHLGSHEDETSALCDWHLPEAHFLETWGDLVAFDGTPGVRQPLIEPLYEGRPAISILAPGTPARDLVRETWHRYSGLNGEDFERFWKTTLHDGFAKRDSLKIPPLIPTKKSTAAPSTELPADIELVIRSDASVGYGEQANNAWMQELPRPFSKLVWDNAALISPALGQRLGLKNGDVVSLRKGNSKELRAPVWIQPGQADRTVTLHLGYGRQKAGVLGNNVGFDAYPLLGHDGELVLQRTGSTHELVSTQHHSVMEGRDLIWQLTAMEVSEGDLKNRPPEVPDVTLYQQPEDMMKGRYAWAMSINLSACIGCSACVTACQAENNIPSVGKQEVARGREMHWIRLDRYYVGESDAPRVVHQPLPCMQCEQAPCEVVCPVEATVHTNDGLNAMIYNRCVGTRYCSNNCPYKVRRFNFFDYRTTKTKSDPRALQANPNVTVRGRGVMEKCTYCVQRIQRAVIASNNEQRRVRDGEILTACQQACPAEAIVFGDLKTPDSKVSKLRVEPTAYALLGELNTRPRTTYLAKITHPHV